VVSWVSRHRRTWEIVGVVCTFLIALLFTAYAVKRGVQRLNAGHPAKDAGTSLWHLVVLSAGAGFISFAVVEFVKRLTPMRALYNSYVVHSWFGGALDDWPSTPASPEGSEGSWRLLIGAEIAAVKEPIAYTGSIQQVCAQVSQRLQPIIKVGGDERVPAPLQRASIKALLQQPSARVFRSEDPDLSWLEAPWTLAGQWSEELQRLLDIRLDTFQIESTNRWRSFLRSLAALTAGLLALSGAWAVAARASVAALLTALLFGVLVGDLWRG